MIIRKIRLHPFAGTADRTFTFSEGLNILSGKNEFGKSTLYNAFQEALFTGTNLTPAVLAKWGNRWFPKPDGDHARVSLHFEADGKAWQLEKVWGAGQQSLLQEEGGNRLADPQGVADKIRSLLKWNEATWTKVLFTRQAELAKTIDELSDNLLGKIDDLETRLKGMAAIPGDIPAEQMKSLLEAEIKKQNSHWETNLSLPEGGRGPGNPWEKNVGLTLQAYYQMETAREKLKFLRDKEAEIQTAREKREKLEQQVKLDREFCLEGESISAGLAQRAILQAELSASNQELQMAQNDFKIWPETNQEIKSLEFLQVRLGPEIEKLQQEYNIARKREKEKGLLQSYQQIVDETKDLAEMKNALKEMPKPDATLISEWESIRKKKENTLIQISALKLKVSIRSKAAVSLRIQEGLETEKNIGLNRGEQWTSEVSGRFFLENQDLELTVENGELDMDALKANLEQLDKRESEIKVALGYHSPEEAKTILRKLEKCTGDILLKEGQLKKLLREKTKEQWDGWHAAFQQLPATRDENYLETEISDKRKELTTIEWNLSRAKDKLEELNRKYTGYESLSNIILDLNDKIRSKETQLIGLPVVPQGYDSIELYLSELEEKKQRNKNSEEQENELKLSIATLSATLPEENAEDLEADFLLKKRNFHRQNERSKALLRIRRTLDEILAKREDVHPQDILAEAVSKRFCQLSRDAYQRIRLGDAMQAEGKTALPFQALSRGTLGSLALAMRLSLGELYLKKMKGLLVLDDPFTDMDESRRTAAVHEIMEFSRHHQVLLITCHSAHTGELLKAGASEVAIETK